MHIAHHSFSILPLLSPLSLPFSHAPHLSFTFSSLSPSSLPSLTHSPSPIPCLYSCINLPPSPLKSHLFLSFPPIPSHLIPFYSVLFRPLHSFSLSGDDGIANSIIRKNKKLGCSKSWPDWPASSAFVTAVGATQLSNVYAPACTASYDVYVTMH